MLGAWKLMNYTSTEWESGLVEGEHVPTPSDVSAFRGQAEGERLEGTGAAPVTSRLHQTPSESGSNNEWDSASKHIIL